MLMRSRIQVFLLLLTLLMILPARAAYDVEWAEFPALQSFNGEPVQLSALQFRPQGQGPFPAIVLLHGCSGMYTRSGNVTNSYRHWAELLSEDGYVALLVDSFN